MTLQKKGDEQDFFSPVHPSINRERSFI